MMIAQAEKWLNLGVSVIPLAARSKQPDYQALRAVGAVHPLTGRPSWACFRERLPSTAELRQWFGMPTSRACNLGVLTGGACGLVVCDFDSEAAWERWPGRAELRTSYQVITRRGRHLYLRCPAAVAAQHRAGVDLIAGGGYVVGAGSVHPSGHVYTAVDPDAAVVEVDSVCEFWPGDRPAVGITKYATGHEHAAGGSLIERAKAAVRIEDLVGEVWPTRPGWFVARCPVPGHGRGRGDLHPSLWIDAGRQVCGCFAGCNGGRPMDVINLVARLQGVPESVAIRRLVDGLL